MASPRVTSEHELELVGEAGPWALGDLPDYQLGNWIVMPR
jgi:hypothetical protein